MTCLAWREEPSLEIIYQVAICTVNCRQVVMVETTDHEFFDVWSYFGDENDWSTGDFTEAEWQGKTVTAMKDELRRRDVAKIRAW